MIDFSNLPVRNKTYAGANGGKISILYNDELYMLKFPAVPGINRERSYTNGFISTLQKDFYKTMLRERKERILDFSDRKF